MRRIIIYINVFFFSIAAIGQHKIDINASLDASKQLLSIEQKITYVNTSATSLKEIYLNDWANSFSSKTSPLAKRFAENYASSFHFEKSEDRGRTIIQEISDSSRKLLNWERGEEVDILKIMLDKELSPGESFSFKLKYLVKVPDDKFTRYGVNKMGDYKLKHWYLSPAVFDGSWQIYSNKNIDDLYLTPSNYSITIHTSDNYFLTSDLNMVSESVAENIKTTCLEGDNRNGVVLYLEKNKSFQSIGTDKFELVTNIQNPRLNSPVQALMIDRVIHFLDDRLGAYPFDKMLVSDTDYRTNPVYGLNLLPSFISPFPDGFEYDIEQFKTISRNYIDNTLILNSRNDAWLKGAFQIYLMMEYVDTYYPKMKIIGSLSDWWIIRWAHAADLEFNDQYPILYLNMARQNIHQPLNTPKDSLLKYNLNIANDYYGGSGLRYLKDYLGDGVLEEAIKGFFLEKKLEQIKTSDFEVFLSSRTDLPINWFFEEYANNRSNIDFKIRKVIKKGDSLEVVLKNKTKNKMPVSVYGLNGEDIVFKTWTHDFDSLTKITIPAKNIKKLALNYESIIPEYNQRNNYKSVHGILNKPIQFRLFQDVEDPKYTQFFFMPIFEYNLYDGLATGVRLYNKTVLPKAFNYNLEPMYGLRSEKLIGSGSFSYKQFLDEDKLYAIRYGFSGKYYSYDYDLFYKRFSPYMTFFFRNNEKQFVNIRSVNVHRDKKENSANQKPNYNVFNLQYVYSNPNLINHFRGVVDYEISSKFSKIAINTEYRKLFLNNRQLDIRFFSGVFLFNDSRENDDFFSFALDRPNDYLFDYNYYGRSETSGLFSQQLIIAEGGFKSQLKPDFANSWMTTVNASTNIWKWIYVYADAGLVHNKGRGTNAVFDSGIRLNLVADYFELYFPIYSSIGFEPNMPNYDQKIRFIVTLSPNTLFGLFTRRWY